MEEKSQPPPAKQRWVLGLRIGVAIGLGALTLTAAAVDRFGQRDSSRAADAIVVLGSRLEPGGIPGDSLRCRTLHAVQLFNAGMAPAILFTGGVGDHPPSEAEASRNLALSLGIPERALVLEESSKSTWENAVNAASLCREKGWRRIILVSDPYHLFRASRNFRKVGLEPYPSPARDCARNRGFVSRAEWALRDTLLLIRDFLVGRI